MSAQPVALPTLEEYLAIERQAPTRHEYRNGLVFAMAGGSRTHDLIAAQAITRLTLAVEDKPCRAHGGTLQIYIAAHNVALYPDAMVICGEDLFAKGRADLVANPLLIVQVLSPSTEAYDRGRKFEYYRALPSLREYILISQDQPQVERFSRQADDSWQISVLRGLQEALPLASINTSIPLGSLYAKVEWPEEGTTPQ